MSDPYRSPSAHPRWVRLTHGVNAFAIAALLVSGVAILLALPKLFWGETGANEATAWITLPLPVDLGQTRWGRNVHFLAAWIFVLNGAVYGSLILLTGRLWRRLLPTAAEMHHGHLIQEVRAHLRPSFRRLRPARYNVLQKLAYVIVVCLLLPTMVLSGLAMSPGVTTAYPELFWLFGGRQSARTIHFLTASAVVLFILVHVWQVFVNDPDRLMLKMTFGRPDRRQP